MTVAEDMMPINREWVNQYTRINVEQIHVPGWDKMLEFSPTRAVTLKAMVELELAGYPLTRQEILEHVRVDPLLTSRGINLSARSGATIQEHLTNLCHEGHIAVIQPIPGRPSYAGKKQKGRGGRKAPWHTAYTRRILKDEAVEQHAAT